MPHCDDGKRLRDMLENAREAAAHAKGKPKEDFLNDRLLQLALIRLIEVVGEAASRISENSRAKYPAIRWKSIVGMRNRIIHVYDLIDWDVLWDTVVNDLPPLIAELERIVPPEGGA